MSKLLDRYNTRFGMRVTVIDHTTPRDCVDHIEYIMECEHEKIKPIELEVIDDD